MDYQTVVALQNSIDHWEENLKNAENNKRVYFGAHRCALCLLYQANHHFSGNSCDGCPINEKSGNNSCRNTPYMHVLEAEDKFFIDPSAKNQFISAIKDEIKFLKDLLP